jgi:hypothetical protein
MSIQMSETTVINTMPEYVVVSININTTLNMDASGSIVELLNLNLNYEKKDFIVDINGKKIGLINKAEDPANIDPLSKGWVHLDQVAFAEYFKKVAIDGESYNVIINKIADDLMRQDLIKRKILIP